MANHHLPPPRKIAHTYRLTTAYVLVASLVLLVLAIIDSQIDNTALCSTCADIVQAVRADVSAMSGRTSV